jgi:peptide/nickel transport system ATP-binding protein
MSALDPVHSIGSQFLEVIRTHTDQSKAEARERAKSLLEDVELDPAVMRDYPHELSGGQRQRAMIALSLVLDPSLIIADEPTTGLDVVVQDDILNLLSKIQDKQNCAIIFITHDINVVTKISDKVGVMYAGQMVEKGDTHEVFTDSKHPYTIGLRNASPSLDQDMSDLITIPGQTENLLDPPTGCRFKSRCPFAEEKCEQDPPSKKLNNNHEAKCHFVDRADEFQQLGQKLETWTQEQ